MKRKLKYFLSMCLLGGIACFIACKQDKLEPAVKDATAPGPVTDPVVRNLNGAAVISFTPPADEDLLYVRAVYQTKTGTKHETKVSKYNRELTVDGFPDTVAYDVSLYAVDKSENASTAVTVTVHPGRPIFQLVRDSISYTADFGGINVRYKNRTESSIAVVLLTNDSTGSFVPVNTAYTKLKQGDFSTRNLKAVDTKFGIYVRDRWGNISDTLLFHLTPLFEEQLDRTKIHPVILPTDAQLGPQYGGGVEKLFDGNTTNAAGYYHTGDDAKMPQWFTIDLGVQAKLSRLSWFMREGFFYDLHNPKVVEIWGTNSPASDGSFNGWTLLASHTQVKPSGLPAGQNSQADIDAAVAGENVTFPLDAPKVRYLRFKTLKNWSNGTYVNFNEIMIWGDTK
ncbi:DUF4959 domain-containing protein [Mucilaginibacter terrenus]|uniref:DUF4959 domain-containing protein n=1 Tax=Mucilaginibacter terrenus TaxID=2482727 RepID=A0A3E2NW42_9SPHI|nr:DUF5000 domain-containing lipoprotein [Mucilaginibacter terrenus]RFZ85233.1 DUF4959 domain-containing protein [Mucilaginibacter terrenus]